MKRVSFLEIIIVKKQFKWILGVVLFILLAFSAYSTWFYLSNKPPETEIILAGKNIALAQKSSARAYSPEKLSQANSLLEQAMQEWKTENDKMFLFRDYTLSRELALKANELAIESGNEAGENSKGLKILVESELISLEKQIARFESKFKQLPLNRKTFDKFNQGKLCFFEAREEIKQNNFTKALEQLKNAEGKVQYADNEALNFLNNYFCDYPVWEKNKALAYSLSQKGQTIIFVNKLNESLVLLKGGKEIKKWKVEFGINWLGDKRTQGDKTTPEGIYHVIEKKSGSNTRYHRALLLDYPNQEDRRRFERLKKSGEIKKNAGIGNLIEIHGHGGKGVHWTDGCIALENSDMDELFRNSPMGATVIIVGSEITLEEYLK